MSDLRGKVIVIAGATGNLGQAVARGLDKAGARLALFGRSDSALQKIIPASTNVLRVSGVDLTSEPSVENAMRTVAGNFGAIDGLVNAAGGFEGGKPVHEDDLETWDRMMTINLRTTLVACRAFVRVARASGRGGRIVNVSARAALSGVSGLGAYSASKAAVIRLTESLAGELRDHGIGVNCVLPGTIDTPQNRKDMPDADHGRWVAPEAIADVIEFLLSDAARAVSGASLPVYGRS